MADDGTEFKIEAQCLQYEKQCERKKYFEKEKEIRMQDLDGQTPLGGGEETEYHNYIWYKLRSEKDIELLESLYNRLNVPHMTSFPAIICLEIYDENYDEDGWYDGDAWVTTLDDVKLATREFWKNFGYHISFKKADENK